LSPLLRLPTNIVFMFFKTGTAIGRGGMGNSVFRIGRRKFLRIWVWLYVPVLSVQAVLKIGASLVMENWHCCPNLDAIGYKEPFFLFPFCVFCLVVE